MKHKLKTVKADTIDEIHFKIKEANVKLREIKHELLSIMEASNTPNYTKRKCAINYFCYTRRSNDKAACYCIRR